MEDDYEERRKNLHGQIRQLLDFRSVDLERREELGAQFNFTNELPLFHRTLDLFAKLGTMNLSAVPDPHVDNLSTIVGQTHNKFQQVFAFSPKSIQGSPETVRQHLLTEMRVQYEQAYNAISPVVAFCSSLDTPVNQLYEEAKIQFADLGSMLASSRTYVSETKEEVERLIGSIRATALEAGVSGRATYFAEEAERHRKLAKGWLWATILIGAATVAGATYSLVVYLIATESLETAKVVQVGVAKLILFSLLYFILVWSSRNHKAHQHNQVVNRHRQNALATFDAFVNYPKNDPATKNAVLLRATETVFSPAQTGYTGVESDYKTSAQVLEIFKDTAHRPT